MVGCADRMGREAGESIQGWGSDCLYGFDYGDGGIYGCSHSSDSGMYRTGFGMYRTGFGNSYESDDENGYENNCDQESESGYDCLPY